MKKYAFLYILAIVILAVVITSRYFNPDNRMEFKSGDTIPSSVKFVNAYGEDNRISDVKSKYKVVFYLDSTNDESIVRLDCISKIINLINIEGISYLIVWDGRIPAEKIKDAGIDSKYNYSLEDKVSLSESKPTAFLTDENNKIIMVTGYSYISLINEIIELGEKRDLSHKAGEMIIRNVSKSGAFSRKDKEKTLLMFMWSGCRKCREHEEIARKNIDSMQKKINVITIRPDFDIRQDYDKHYEIDPQEIYFNIYSYAYGIEASLRKYPLFVILNSDNSIEKLFTDVNEAVKYTLGL
ncbi:hypothetical protein [Pseudobacteroides cellulosolvens]|uniref:Thioredoxin-like fold domain-containing protein n=1 Tax=Pseudobacteroides cellulosolvens ATCC 35603 = DSM 2933 TaxID=398512 RepID=A0A0L6JPZ5_9FIRM|nr:hypothetical protein [Pseudobacteroides cellulosolvens]KNY27853.1 hypothetical protein Bccel_3124 [Pseudobacteroides cellulosolvens ATCC 35603 = DSM 2933]